MQVVLFLVPLGLIIVVAAIWAFCWAVNSGQFNDLEQPAYQIIFDDKEARQSEKSHDE